MASTTRAKWLAAPGSRVETARWARVAGHLVELSDRLNRAAEAFIIVDLAAMTALVIADVVARTTVASIIWSEELGVRFFGTWFVFVGASVAFKRGQLVAIIFFVERLPGRVQRAVYTMTGVLIAGFIVVVLYYGIDLVTFTFAQPSPVMEVPMGLAYLGVPVGSAIMLIHAAALALQGRAVAGVATVA